MQPFFLQPEVERPLLEKSARPVKRGSLGGGIDKDIGEQAARHEGFGVFQQHPANPAALAIRRNEQKPDFIQIQPHEPFYLALCLVNRDIEKPGTLNHGLGRFAGSDRFA